MKKLLPFILCLCWTLVNAQINEKKITFQSGDWELKGTLTLPQGEGPFPGFVFVHGSGPNDRDQTTPLVGGNAQCLYPQLAGETIKTFEDLAESLTQKGYAVLRYDKRTHTYGSQLNQQEISPFDFIQDAKEATRFLKNESKVNQHSIFLLGHSQGANFLPHITENMGGIAGLISVAGTTESIDSVLARQTKDILIQCGDSSQAQQQYEQTLNVFTQVRNGNWPSNQPISGAYPKFWRDWIAITDSTIQDFQETDIPTLFLHGTNDFNVPPKHGQIWQNKVQRPLADVFFLDSINHYLTPPSEPQVAPRIPDTIDWWIRKNKLTGLLPEKREQLKKLKLRYTENGILIEVPQNFKKATFNVVNVEGRVVKTMLTNQKSAYLSFDGLNPGIYLLRGKGKLSNYYGKFMVRK